MYRLGIIFLKDLKKFSIGSNQRYGHKMYVKNIVVNKKK